jgi:hypothetical protein
MFGMSYYDSNRRAIMKWREKNKKMSGSNRQTDSLPEPAQKSKISDRWWVIKRADGELLKGSDNKVLFFPTPDEAMQHITIKGNSPHLTVEEVLIDRLVGR